jgi:hypothetical protein
MARGTRRTGLETLDDIVADLDQALRRAAAATRSAAE